MGFDLPHLQLIFNVIVITGFTSLALICALLKRDNDKLAIELERYRDQGEDDAQILTASPVQLIPAAVHEDFHKQDIRKYVSYRMRDWSELQKDAAVKSARPAID
jgi:hypothetical protein